MIGERFHSLTIKTPEGVSFEYFLASPLVRALALALDYIAIWVFYGVVSVFIQLLGLVSSDIAIAFYVISYFVVSIGYFFLLEFAWQGKTIGKKMLNLRVMDARGYRLRFDQIVMRNLMRFVDSLPFFYFLGGVISLANQKSQRLGDVISGTVVVRIPEKEIPKLTDLSELKFNSFSEHPRLEALLRERVTPVQAKIALQALQRREQLEPEARLELFAELADYFKELVAFPGDVGDLLSDEQYVRNCVESIFRKAG